MSQLSKYPRRLRCVKEVVRDLASVLQRDSYQGIFISIRFTHKGLQRFHERNDPRGLNADHVERIRRVLTALQDARSPRNMDLPDWRRFDSRGIGAGIGACVYPSTGESSSASLPARRWTWI